MQLDDTVVLITGASRGLGRSMAHRFVEEGARVSLVSRTESTLEAVADEIDGETLVAPADVRDRQSVEDAISKTVEAFGRIDTLVNNAGVSQLGLTDERVPLVDVDESMWDLVLETNLKGVYLFTKHSIPHMQASERPNIINISSGLGRHAVGGAGPYVASKWGLEGLTRVVALEHEDEINVNALDPGGRVDTDIWAHLPAEERDQILDPDVMDDAAVMIAALEPGSITGESMTAADWEDRLE
ncbi:MAG: SDR family NAD(P)-dependent oxidoreductase [Natronomonas sp.]